MTNRFLLASTLAVLASILSAQAQSHGKTPADIPCRLLKILNANRIICRPIARGSALPFTVVIWGLEPAPGKSQRVAAAQTIAALAKEGPFDVMPRSIAASTQVVSGDVNVQPAANSHQKPRSLAYILVRRGLCSVRLPSGKPTPSDRNLLEAQRASKRDHAGMWR
ncbi:MAG TPA: hypothetical protein VMI31_09650 [Fimbriimonadaceae bacterium]|nr:hypothetical protein [Fimbriimonadaceae bacterium]